MLKKKAQSSIEFIIIISIVLIVFGSVLLIIAQNVNYKNKEKINLEMIKMAESVKKEIELAAIASDGYQRTFSIPEKILSQEYSMDITAESLYFRTIDGKNSFSLSIPKVQGQLKKGKNVIKKINETIFLN